METALGIALLYVMIIIEFLIIHFSMKEPLPWKEMVLNLNSGHVLMWVGRGIEVLCYSYVLNHFTLGWISHWPKAIQWIFVFVAWDFCFYWLHRLHHSIPLLWNIHVVHHQGEHFSLSLGIRNSWYSSLTSIPFFIPLAILGASLEQFVIVGSIHYFIQFYNHNHLVKKSGWLEHIMVTPAHHKVHHGRNPEYLDKNCSGAFIIWDKLFGTFQTELKDVPIKLGIDKPVKSKNPFWINTVPFLRFLKMKEPSFKAEKLPVYMLSDFIIGVGGLLLFGWLLFYISVEKSWDTLQLSCLFVIIFFSTISICGLAEGRIWGMISWILFFCFGLSVFIWQYSVSLFVILLFIFSMAYSLIIIINFYSQLINKTKLSPLINS